MAAQVEQEAIPPGENRGDFHSFDFQSPQYRRDLIQRICDSDGFRRSKRLCEFLQFISEKAIEGDVSEIHERQIAVEVYGRPDGSYDPSLDNTVRVQARSLRQKLAEYFHGPGRDEPLIVEVPKGGYVPVFRLREGEISAPLSADGTADEGVSNPHFQWLLVAGICVLVASLALNAFLLFSSVRDEQGARGRSSGVLVRNLIQLDQPTLLVVPDTGFVVAQVLTHKPLGLQNYGEAAYRSALFDSSTDRANRDFWGYMLSRRFTDIYSLKFFRRLVDGFSEVPTELVLKHPRELHLHDFAGKNAILLGSPRSNPWVDAFKEHLCFHFESRENGEELIRNACPEAGEPLHIEEAPTQLGSGRAVGILSSIPNPYPPGQVMIIAGTTAAVTDAIATVVTTPEGLEKLSSELRLEDASKLNRLEAVISAGLLDGALKDWKLVAHRMEER